MNTNNATIQGGVDAYNKTQQDAAEALVVGAIRDIKCQQSKIETANAQIVGYRAELAKVKDDVITDVSVTGAKLDTTDNPNAATMAAAIKRLNAARQSNVTAQTELLTKRITEQQDYIRNCEKAIADIRENMAKIAAKTVTVTDVVGN